MKLKVTIVTMAIAALALSVSGVAYSKGKPKPATTASNQSGSGGITGGGASQPLVTEDADGSGGGWGAGGHPGLPPAPAPAAEDPPPDDYNAAPDPGYTGGCWGSDIRINDQIGWAVDNEGGYGVVTMHVDWCADNIGTVYWSSVSDLSHSEIGHIVFDHWSFYNASPACDRGDAWKLNVDWVVCLVGYGCFAEYPYEHKVTVCGGGVVYVT